MVPKLSVRIVLSGVFLASGAALVVYILSGISLLATFLVCLVLAIVFGALLWRRLQPDERLGMRQFLVVGFWAGLIATGAYDLSRLFLIEVTGIQFWPFDIFNIFGQALVGSAYGGAWVRLIGLVYHFINGIGFAIAYTVLAGRKGVLAGIGWALALEALMLTFYPGWLDIRAIQEFTQVSIVGHVVYGWVLGFVAKRMLTTAEDTYGNTKPF